MKHLYNNRQIDILQRAICDARIRIAQDPTNTSRVLCQQTLIADWQQEILRLGGIPEKSHVVTKVPEVSSLDRFVMVVVSFAIAILIGTVLALVAYSLDW